MLPILARVTKASHFFRLSDMSDRLKQHAYDYLRKFMHVDATRSNPKSPNPQEPKVTMFADGTKDHSEFRFHANNFPGFLEFLGQRHISEKELQVEVLDIPQGDDFVFDVRPGWIARDNQQAPIDYLIADNGPRSRFIGLQTGQGKGFITMKTLSEIGKRTIVIVRPMFVDKWVAELKQILDLSDENIMVVQGAPDLKAFLAMCTVPESIENIGVVIISNKTLQPWLKLYSEFKEETLEMGYACLPEQLFEHARASLRAVDEVHLDFHLNHRIDLHTNVFRAISLSATLLDDDPFVSKMQKIAYPMVDRFNGGAIKKYVHAVGVMYYHDPDHRVRTSEFGSSSYAHTAYEKSIIRSNRFFTNYARMVAKIVQVGYLEEYQPKDRCIVYCASIDMCTRMTEFLAAAYPHLTVRRFVEEDPEENMREADIRVTTPGSGSTGHDIKNLTCNILTVGVRSSKTNIQVLGRLREFPGRTLRFYFLTCFDIPKHAVIHKEKMKLLEERALTVRTQPYGERI